jgi:putative DNA primase/helicase
MAYSLNWDEARRFTECIAGKSDPKLTFQVFDDKKKHPERAAIHHGRLSDSKTRRWLFKQNKRGCGVYVVVNETDFNGRRRENIKAARAIWADFDGTPLPAKWDTEPDCIVETSPGKFQVFWLIEPDADLDRASQLQKSVASRFGSDPKITDPARVCRLAGFYHQKKEPFRSRIIKCVAPQNSRSNSFDRKLVSDIPALLSLGREANVPRSPTPSQGEQIVWDSEAAKRRAREYLRHAPPSIEGQNGDNNAYKVACKLNDLGISIKLSATLMEECWNDRCEPSWSEADLRRFARNAARYKANPAGSDSAGEDFSELEGHKPALSAKKPFEIAKNFRSDRHPTLLHYGREWFEYDGLKYVKREDGYVRASIYQYLDGSLDPAMQLVNNVMDSLKGQCHQIKDTFQPPCWLNGSGPFPASEVIVFKGGLLHLPTLKVIEPTPNFFALNALDYSFDRLAATPAAWLQFLNQVFKGSPGSIETLQEIFGYLLTPDTSMQKAFLWDGPKRGGKGTTLRVLERLIGTDNCVSPSITALAKDPILAAMIGKQLAIVSDMRISAKTDLGAVSENLLRITGEDRITFDRKYIDSYTGRLQVRFFIATNLPPNFADVSGAMAHRFIMLVSYESFYGREDTTLEARLLNELPGILNWAIEGWKRLNERGRFVQSPAGQKMLDRMVEMGSPILAFLKDKCVLEPSAKISKTALYERYKPWAEENGLSPVTHAVFARNLNAMVRNKVRETKLRGLGERVPSWLGIRLKTQDDNRREWMARTPRQPAKLGPDGPGNRTGGESEYVLRIVLD